MDLHTQLSKNMDDIVNLFESRMKNFDKALAQTQTSSRSTNNTVFSDLSSLASDYMVFKDLVWKTLAMIRQQLQLLSAGYDKHEMLSRRKVLLFHGLSEDAEEQPDTKVYDVICNKMKLCNVDVSNIDLSHRLGAKRDKPRPILVRFTSLKARNSVWNAKTALKGSGITVSEFLTKCRQEVLVTARKHFGLKSCWSSDGMIVIALPDKSRKKISTLHELQPLLGKFPLDQCTQDPKPSRSRRINKNSVK